MNEIQKFDAQEVQRGETKQGAMAARETAEIQARFIMAVNRPRDVERFRVKLLAECKRMGFAEAAEYFKPVGKKQNDAGQWEQQFATGPSIRMIEAATQFYGNLDIKDQIIYETEEYRVIECAVLDLETNTRWSQNRTIPKTVEKRGEKQRGAKEATAPAGREVIGERVNTYGDKVYVVRATAEEMQLKQASEASKGCRTEATRLLPSDIVAEALAACRETVKKQITEDPKAAIRRLIDGFASLGVTPDDLELFLEGRKIEQLQPKEMQQLRQLWAAIKDGQTTWREAMDARDPQGSLAAAEKATREKIEALKKSADEAQGLRETEPRALSMDLRMVPAAKAVDDEAAEFDRKQAEQQAKESGKRGKMSL